KEAVGWTEQAVQRESNNLMMRKVYWDALLAAGLYDRLLRETLTQNMPLFESGPQLEVRLRTQAAKGDKAGARATIDEALGQVKGPEAEALRQHLRAWLQGSLCAAEGDVAGYLQAVEAVQDMPQFERPLLRGKLQDAAAGIERQNDD